MRLFLIDCYGTLVEGPRRTAHETADALAERLDVAARDAARVLVEPLFTGAYLPAERQRSTVGVLRAGLAALDRADRLAATLDVLWETQGNGRRDHVALAGARELLAAIRAQGDAARVISNCVLTPQQMRALLDDVGLGPFVDAVFASSAGRGKKPDPAFVARAGEGDFVERVLVGDDPACDLAPARRLGWKAVAVSRQAPFYEAVWQELKVAA